MAQVDTSIIMGVRPVHIEDPLAQFSKVQGIRNMIQQGRDREVETQYRQEEVKKQQISNAKATRDAQDQEIVRNAYVKANGVPEDTIKAAIQGGAGPGAVQDLQKHFGDLAEHAAKTASDKLAVDKNKNDQFLALHDSALDMIHTNPQQFQQAWPQFYQRIAEIEPESAKRLDPTTPPSAGDIQVSRALHQTLDYNLKSEEQKRAAAKAAQDAAEADRKAKLFPSQMKEAENKALTSTPNEAGLTPEQVQQAKDRKATSDESKKTADYKNYELSKGEGFKGTFEQWQTEDANRKKQPVAKIPTSSLPGLENVPEHLAAPAAAAFNKSAVAYADAKSTADEIQSVIDLVRSGNKAAGSNLPLLGVGALNAINGIKRMNSAEINQYQGAGSLWDHIVGRVGKLVEGQPIPADVLDDIEQLHKRLAEGAVKKHSAEVQAINASHGSTFKPMNIGSPETGGKYKAGDKRVINGKTVTRDDNGHWN